MSTGAPRRTPTQAAAAAADEGIVAIRLRLIGQMEAWTLASENALPVGRKTRALLAILALSLPRPVLRARLAELLWSRRPEEQARASLRQEIHRLLATLGPAASALLVNRDHIGLRPGSTWIDVEEVMRATIARPAGLALLDGELLEDLNGVDVVFDAWLAAERERLRDRARALAEAVLLTQTEADGVIAAARQLLAIDSSHEGAWRSMMRAYVSRGERGMAIQAFERCRVVLAERLDARPSEETHRLVAEIRANGGARAAADGGLAKVAPAVPVAAAPLAATPHRHATHRAGPRTGSGPRPGTEPRPGAEPRPEAAAPVPAANVPRGGARVGVLPLQLIGAPEAMAHLGISLAEEITSALARFRWIFLVSSSSLARFSIQTRDEAAIRRTFDLHFLLDGSIQRVQDRLRISMRLLDLRAGNQVVWSRRFDRNSDDLLNLQDEIAGEAVAQIDPELLLIESQRVAARPVTDASAYDLLLRALPLIDRLERSLFLRAGALLRQAIAQERDYAAAHAWYAYWHIFLVCQGWTSDPVAGMDEASRLADRAILLDPQDAKALTIAGHVRAVLHRRLREGIALHERALAQNPNLAMAWSLSGLAYAYQGDLMEAERRMLRYKTLSPMDPHAFFFDTGLIVVALLNRDHDAAVAIGRRVSDLNPAFSDPYKPDLSALGHLDLTAEAAIVRGRLLAMEPGFSIGAFLDSSPFEMAEHRDHYAEGLRRAGVPP